MNYLLRECVLQEHCSYLPNMEQQTHYKIIKNCSAVYCQELIERGWRRFGYMFFRPVCRDCTACESIKIDAKHYTFSKSERRVLKKSASLRIVEQIPSVTDAHIDLFNKFHHYMHHKKGWEKQHVNPNNYYASFVQGHGDFGKEVLYYDNDKLIGVDLIDRLDAGISSIYFYYDPAYAHLSLGKLSLLKQIEWAKESELKWIYLGYYVKENDSLSYKSQYKPYYQLDGRVEENQMPYWFRALE